MPPSDAPPPPAGRSDGGARSPVDRLSAVLAAARGTGTGTGPSAEELAELLWLARHMAPPPGTPDEDGAWAARPPRAAPPTAGRRPAAPPEPPHPALPEPPPEDRVPLHLPAGPGPRPRPGPQGTPRTADPASGSGAAARPGTPGPAGGGTGVRVPVPPMVSRPLALQRALRPLGRRVPAPDRRVLDEAATAHRIAALGAGPRAWLPVLRPADERWLRLCLVYDDGPTMPLWLPLVRELHTALVQSGLFRTVELHRVAPDGTVPARAAEVPATGRTVTLVVSDCMGPQWREGPAGRRWFRTLRHWADRLPLAVVQPLPERLWPTTAFPAAPGLLGAPHAAAPAAALGFAPYDGSAPPCGAVPVPVVEVAPAWLRHWAELVADTGGRQLPGAAAWLGPAPARPDDEPREDIALLSAEDLVLRFRSSASPEAFRLAGHLAVGEPHLPVMRLVHAAVSRRPLPQHLAEVVLSGMLSERPGGEPGAYAFREGVREVLLTTLPRSAKGRTRQLLVRVGALIDERAGTAPGELRAVAPGTGRGAEEVAAEPFAEVSPDSVRRLTERTGLFAGRYRLLHRMAAADEWLAEDTHDDRARVLIRTYSRQTWGRLHVLGNAMRLVRLRHPGLAAITDYGIAENSPYVVQEFVHGNNLRILLRDSPHGLPAPQLISLLPGIAEALALLHDHGLPHGALSLRTVFVTPEGPVLKVLDFVPLGTASRTDDFRALGELVRTLCLGQEPRGTLHLRLTGLPERLRVVLETSIADLLSHHPDTQEEGFTRLRDLAFTGRRYCFFGRVRVFQDERSLPTGPGPEQAVLLALVRAEGEPVDEDGLVAALWDEDDVPPDADRLVDAYALHLSENLGVMEDDDGCFLPVDPVEGTAAVDVLRFRDLHAEAERAHAAGSTRAFAERAAAALALWTDEPLEGVPGPAARAFRAQLRGMRQSLLERVSDTGTTLSFAFAARPGWQADALTKLSRAVVELLVQGGVEAEQFELLPRENGWDATLGPGTPLPELMTVLLEELPDVVRRFNGLGLLVTVDDPPGPGLPPSTDHAVVVVPSGLREALGDPLFEPVPGADAWYRRLPAAPGLLAADLDRAAAFVLGFDGTLARLYAPGKARDAVQRLLSLAVRERDPEGVRPPAGTTFTHPVDVLRAFAGEGALAGELHDQLDRIERQAVHGARPVPHAAALVRAVRAARRGLAVVTDTAPRAVATYVATHALDVPADAIACRTPDLTRLLPDPDGLRRVLGRLGTPAERCVMIGSTVAEAGAAAAAGVPFVGLAPDDRARDRLLAAGARHTVGSLAEVVDAVRGR
ncbi:SAV_2336 N-terminal domain-related protein [Streptomyces sp. AN091965]|uniref:SAV_2336 N-terminal domain-related protein n=1 Tax=Streptomyces sp. AN091965 TaxID=2927803 RepID=UPI001F6186B0|nr:SAV_2336 N-terminal domain-related protein [Streptomyces sp. AN091965]MCI3930476.1 protein kinase [Streptomyces sp. AN091965]